MRFGHDVPIPKIRCKIRKAIEDTLQKSVAILMEIRHRTNTSGLLTIETNFRSICQRIGWGSSLKQIAVMIVSILMHKLEKYVIFCMVPMQAIAVFYFVLWESAKSMMFLEVAFISLISSQSIRHLFLWGRKTDGSTDNALSLRLVTFSVAKFPCRI